MTKKYKQCHICDSGMNQFSQAQIMKKYSVKYYQCMHCGFIQTEEPFWLQEAYNDAITNSDIGMINRNITIEKITKAVIHCCFNSDGQFLDYGGGYGIFVRLMRDAGFNFYYYDRYCTNLFAKGFEGLVDGDKYELVTAFELLEHLANPYQEIVEMLKVSNSILFTTDLLPTHNPKPGEWWYYGLEHGQHISFYTLKSLEEMAKKLGLNLYSNGSSIHLLTANEISPIFKIISKYSVAKLVSWGIKRKSLLQQDYLQVTGNLLK
jgi:2-polyprenyl-3-methyl-5-hydroxy-6-metoxy-1,4-benzoquinol methylase